MQTSERILFVDDEAGIRNAFARLLRTAGFSVDVAEDGEMAVGLANRNQYAVVATDYRLPQVDGLGIIHRLKLTQPDAVFLLVTGATDLRLPDECDDAASITQIVFKPWNPTRLGATIDRAICLHKQRVARKQVENALRQEPSEERKVLVIEDNEADFAMVEHMLEREELESYSLSRARTMSEALAAIHRTRFDMLLVDLGLPDARGLTAVAMVRGACATAPIVVLSGRDDEMLERQAVAVGADDFLLKGTFVSRDLCRCMAFAFQRKQAQKRLTHLAHYHPLTHLPNRVLFRDRLAHALDGSNRRKSQTGVMFIDLDRFKSVNDTYGHEVGDQLLVHVADCLRSCARASDTVAHLSGDEFTVVLEDVEGSEGATVMASRVLESLNRPVRVEGHDLFVTCSIGISLYPKSSTLEDLVRHADEAMYQAKRLGRNQFAVYTAGLGDKCTNQLSLESDLSLALEREEFALAYQPILELHSGRLVGVEALLRWRKEGREMIPPQLFIRLLEETGLIVSVGLWIAQTVAKDYRDWRTKDLPEFSVSVNTSARQFKEKDFAQSLCERLGSLEPGVIKLELTESLLFDDSNETLAILQDLKQRGFRLSVDDFGTGWSSLGYLNRYPIDELKIDRSFVQQLPGDEKTCSLTSAIIGLAHSLGLRVVAEGIEDSDQRNYLQERNCDYMQGFLYARPMSSEQLVAWCHEHSAADGHVVGRPQSMIVPADRGQSSTSADVIAALRDIA